MNEALGLVETRGITNAIFAADVMVKTANVHIIEIENTRGSGYITVKIAGDVGAVNAAVSAGKNAAIQYNSLISAKVIPRPSEEVQNTFCNAGDKKQKSVQKDKEESQIQKKKDSNIDINEEKNSSESLEIKVKAIEEKKEDEVREDISEVKKSDIVKKAKTQVKKPRKATRKKSETKKNEPDKE